MLWPRCHNLKVRWFSQGLPCKTPLRTHSKQAILLPSTQSSLKPWTVLIPKMPCLTKWKQNKDLALSWGCKEALFRGPASNLDLDLAVQVPYQGCWDADEVGAEGTTTMSRKEWKRFPPPISITGLVISSFEQRGERHLWLVFWTIFLEESFTMSGLNRV